MRFSLLGFAAALLTLGSFGCGGGDGGPSAPPVDNTPATLTLSPSSAATIVSGASTTIVANVAAHDGHLLTSGGVIWTTSDASVASVSAGTVTGTKAGTATITAALGTLAASVAVTVTPGAAAQVAVRTQPGGAAIGAALGVQPVVEIRDAAGNVVPSSNAAVTVAIATGGGTLGGTTTVTAVNGVATFSGLSISGAAGDRSLIFSSSGLASATSATFTMTPPVAQIIGVDATAISLSTNRGASPAPGRVNISNLGALAVVGLTIEATTYDAGQPTGWLTPSLSTTTAPAVLVLTLNSNALAEGTYHAVVRVNAPAATNGPVSIGVTLTVTAVANITFGATTERVKVLDAGSSFSPAVTIVDQNGTPTTAAVTYATRSAAVATVGSDGRVTARAPGDAWIVASTPTSADSVFVILPNGAGPIVRTNITNWSTRLADTLFVTVLLDTRGATVGSAALAVDPSVPAAVLFSTPTTTPTPTVTLTTSGVIRIALGSATGMTGSIAVLNLKITSRAAFSGYVYLYGLDLSAVDGTSLTTATSSTRLPVVFR